ncbi:MAG: hypothetical protein EU532_11010 [Promethearchaeota archaeon]|nr:MAG: hypothetical protein EU532_11010 [Candidatus Lokiarchaeota archaeon]
MKIYPLFAQKNENNIKGQFLEIFGQKSDDDLEFMALISFQDAAMRESFILKHQQLNIIKKFNIIPSILIKLRKNQIQNFQNDELINRIEEDQKLYLSMLKVNEIVGLNEYRKCDIPFSGNNVIIGIIDNGINPYFETISGNIIKKYSQNGYNIGKFERMNEADVNHGTLMAHLISSRFLDHRGRMIGIAPNAKLIDFDISNSNQDYYFSNILEFFDMILKNSIHLDILLIPLTTLDPSDGKDLLSIACNLLVEKGFIILCPAGNFGPESYTIGSPSAAEKVITVGGLTKKMSVAYYSGRGPTLDERLKPDFCLLSSKIEIPLSNKFKVKFSGTSNAAALAAGIIALLKEWNPNLTYKDITEMIQNAKINLNYEKISQGIGTVNLMEIFKELGYYPERNQQIMPYNYLIRRSLKLSIEIGLVFIILYFIIFYFNLIFNILNIN